MSSRKNDHVVEESGAAATQSSQSPPLQGDAHDLVRMDALWPLIEARAARTPDALFALDESGRTLSFAEYNRACRACAAGLAEMGIGAGRVVSWQLPTRLDALVLCSALARLGALQNPLLPMLRAREVGFITRQLGSDFLFVPGRFRGFDFAAMAHEVAASDCPGLDVCVVETGELPQGDPERLPPFTETSAAPETKDADAPVEPGLSARAAVAPLNTSVPATSAPAAATPAPTATAATDNDEAKQAPVRWALYSSGTTADPKGALHSDASLAAPGRAMVRAFETRASDRHAFVFPLTHVGGINWLFAGLMSGFAHLCVEVFHPQETPAWLKEQGVTLAGAGTVFHQAYLAAPRMERVRCYPGGGAPKPQELYYKLKRRGGAPIVSGYGLTEYPIATLGRLGAADEELAESEGRATPGTEIRIVKTDGSLAAPGESGEVRLRGPHLFRGYVDAALNRDAFDDEGFLRSGDLGALSEDGALRITGRLKDVIIRKGENISAGEVEAQLIRHPALADVAVIGLPDAERGERVCAVVVCAAGQRFDFEEMLRFLKQQKLAPQKIPEQLELLDALPRNPAGKVLKRELVERFSANAADTHHAGEGADGPDNG